MDLNILILCVVLSQAIGILSKENFEESSDLLVRKKRLIDRTPEGRVPRPISEVPYIINVLKGGMRHCAGAILTSQVVITIAECVEKHATHSVLSASSNLRVGIHHNITRVFQHRSNIAILVVSPRFNLINSPNRRIKIAKGTMPPRTTATISGWENIGTRDGPLYSLELRSTFVPIISQQHCRSIYHGHFTITDEHICTLHKYRNNDHRDNGNPLVVQGSLAGLFVWRGNLKGQEQPDVYVKLTNLKLRNWIILTVEQYL